MTKLKQLMKERNIKVAYLAEQLKIAPAYVYMIMSGYRRTPLKLAVRISEIFGIPVEELLDARSERSDKRKSADRRYDEKQ